VTATPIRVATDALDEFDRIAADFWLRDAWIIVTETGDRIQHGETYYANKADAEKDAAWQAREGTTYRVERVRTSVHCLTHASRIPEFKRAAKLREQSDRIRAETSRLVGKGFSFWDASMMAKRSVGL
jgi:hypothetical protein